MLHHKVAVSALTAALCWTTGDGLRAQEPAPRQFVQAVIPDLRNAGQAHEVDLALRGIAGVRMSRTDFNTRNVLLEVAPDCAISAEQLTLLLLPYELTLTCYSRSTADGHAFRPLDPRDCGQAPAVR